MKDQVFEGPTGLSRLKNEDEEGEVGANEHNLDGECKDEVEARTI